MNLIICCTPFQMMLAEKIMGLYPDEKFFAIIITPNNNQKYSYYAHRLSSKCIDSFVFDYRIYKSKIFRFIDYINFRNNIRKNIVKVDKVFLANIELFLVYMIMGSIQFDSIHTFDDGTKNIDKDSEYYYEYQRKSLLYRFTYHFFGCKHDMISIKKLSKKHYTVYKDMENIIENKFYIEFLDKKISNYDIKKTVKIFLGQPLFDVIHSKGLFDREEILKMNIEIVNYIKNNIDFDFYFPHPRENYHISDVNYIDTPLVFEDYFLKNAACDTKYVIYTFFSGSVVFLKDFHNVDVLSVRPKLIDDYNVCIDSCYNMMQNLGVAVIEV